MKQIIVLFTLVTISIMSFAFIPPKAGDKTKDVLAYAKKHAEFPDRGFNSFACDNCTALKNSIFVTPISTCGTGSCDYMIFEKAGKEAIYRASVSLKPGSFEFLKSSHNGLPDIKYYRHTSADDGLVGIMEFDGSIYKDLNATKKVSSKQFENEIKPEKVIESTLK
jgi:hypothetical protein